MVREIFNPLFVSEKSQEELSEVPNHLERFRNAYALWFRHNEALIYYKSWNRTDDAARVDAVVTNALDEMVGILREQAHAKGSAAFDELMQSLLGMSFDTLEKRRSLGVYLLRTLLDDLKQ